MSTEIDCTDVDDIALHCAREVTKRAYLPSVASGSTWVVEADGMPFAVIARHADDAITVTGAERDIAVNGEEFALFFSYQLKRDTEELLAEIHAGHRPRR